MISVLDVRTRTTTIDETVLAHAKAHFQAAKPSRHAQTGSSSSDVSHSSSYFRQWSRFSITHAY
jgi:hypothetical protein